MPNFLQTVVPQPPSISLRELEEYRLCTVECQAAVEELRDEIETIISDLNGQESKVCAPSKSSLIYITIKLLCMIIYFDLSSMFLVTAARYRKSCSFFKANHAEHSS